jgi:hypothetical protein
MKNIRRLLIASVVLGLVSLGCFVLERFALTDIFHGEQDLSSEWRIVSASFLPILAFHVLAVVAAFMALRYMADHKADAR